MVLDANPFFFRVGYVLPLGDPCFISILHIFCKDKSCHRRKQISPVLSHNSRHQLFLIEDGNLNCLIRLDGTGTVSHVSTKTVSSVGFTLSFKPEF